MNSSKNRYNCDNTPPKYTHFYHLIPFLIPELCESADTGDHLIPVLLKFKNLLNKEHKSPISTSVIRRLS